MEVMHYLLCKFNWFFYNLQTDVKENYSKCEKCLTELLQIILCNETDAVYTHINYNWSEML